VRYRDRVDAGRSLGQRLREERLDDPVVLGLPRGGVIVAAEVAEMLDAPLDVQVARKLRVPWQPELAFGAVAPGVVVLQNDVLRAVDLDQRTIDETAALETAQLDGLAHAYRGGLAPIPLRSRTVIIVDDGLATGATATAAVRSVRRDGPARIVVAVPVCATETAQALRREVDALVCLGEHRDFRAVGLYYDDFSAVEDGAVRERLERSHGAAARR
jgi:putative phosphoribosyl transferase